MPERYFEFYSLDESRPTIRTLDTYYMNKETGDGFITFEGTYNADLVYPHRLCFKTILCEDEPYKIEETENGVTYMYKDIERNTYEVEVYKYDKKGQLYTIYFRIKEKILKRSDLYKYLDPDVIRTFNI
jgi:hypothetical protein